MERYIKLLNLWVTRAEQALEKNPKLAALLLAMAAELAHAHQTGECPSARPAEMKCHHLAAMDSRVRKLLDKLATIPNAYKE